MNLEFKKVYKTELFVMSLVTKITQMTTHNSIKHFNLKFSIDKVARTSKSKGDVKYP